MGRGVLGLCAKTVNGEDPLGELRRI